MTMIGHREAGRIGLGTAPLAFKDAGREQAVATIHAALDAGVRLIDTALAYTRAGVESYAETIVSAALSQRADRGEVLVATKGGHRRAGEAFPVDASPAALRADCETSLRSLGVERIDLYQLHHVDPRVPLLDSLGTLVELRAEGKIGEIGLSNVAVGQIDEAVAGAPIVSVQNRLSLTDRADLATARHCERIGVAYLAYQPLGGLSGQRVDPVVSDLAARLGISMQQVWLAWLLAQGAKLLPLVGSTRPATIMDSAAAVEAQLDPDDLRLLDQLG